MSTKGPIEARIREKLVRELEPRHLEITNESYKHSVPKGSESHFKVCQTKLGSFSVALQVCSGCVLAISSLSQTLWSSPLSIRFVSELSQNHFLLTVSLSLWL